MKISETNVKPIVSGFQNHVSFLGKDSFVYFFLFISGHCVVQYFGRWWISGILTHELMIN